MLKKVLALTLVLALCLGLSTVAWAAAADGTAYGGTDIIGEADYNAPLYVVIVPTNFNFAIDPIEMGGEGQFYCGDNGFVFANKSAAPILINVDLTMTATTGVTIVDDPDAVDDSLNAASGEKNVYIGVQAPTTMAATSGVLVDDPALASTNIEAIYNSDIATTIVPLTVDSATGANKSFSLALETGNAGSNADVSTDPDTGEDNYAEDENSLGGFKLYGKLTTYNKTWAKKDLTIGGEYEFQALRADDYTTAIGKKEAGTWNLYLGGGTEADGSENDPIVLTAGRAGSVTIPIAYGTTVGTADVYLKLVGANPALTALYSSTGSLPGAAGETVGKIYAQMVRPDQSVYVLPNTGFTYTNGIFHFTMTTVAPGARSLNIVTPTATYRLDYVGVVDPEPAP